MSFMYTILLIPMVLTVLKEEIYDYQVGLMITQPQEDFLFDLNSFDQKNLDPQKFQNFDKLGLIRQSNHSFDIIDMKQNEFDQSDLIWILYRKGNESLLSKQSIESNVENYHLNLKYECYSLHFINKYNLVIDCQNFKSNILLLYDIEKKLLQSYFHSYYQQSKLRKLIKIESSNLLIFIQQEQFYTLCFNQNKYQVCDKLTYFNNAHTVYGYQNEIILISDNFIDIFQINSLSQSKIVYKQRENFSNLQQVILNPIYYYFYIYNNQYQNIVQSYQIKLCNIVCQTIQLDNPPLKIDVYQNYLIIQTENIIVIHCMLYEKTFKINIQYNHEIVIVNRRLEEFYIMNNNQMMFYGSTQAPYFRVVNQTNIIDNLSYFDQYQNIYFEHLDNLKVLFDNQFKFKRYNYLLVQNNRFLLIGGLLDISFIVEPIYEGKIRISLTYFKNFKYKNVQYFWFKVNNPAHLDHSIYIYHINQTIFNSKFGYLQGSQDKQNNFSFLQLIESFNQGYLMQDIRYDKRYVMIFNQKIELVQLNCNDSLSLIQCINNICICITANQLQIISISSEIQIIYITKSKRDRFIHFDEENIILYMVNNNQLVIKYFNIYFNQIHIKFIQMCTPFINLIDLKLKLVIVCTEQMILLNKVSNFRLIFSGFVDLYDQKFSTSSQVINNNHYLFYIIENGVLHVFNSNLPLSQMYVTQTKLDKFELVKAQNNEICFQYKQNLQCYQYQINLQFSYNDNVEYHQVFKVNICGQNKYNKICREYITRLDQQNRKINIKRNKYQVRIDKNTKEIVLDNRYFTGSIDKIKLNKYRFKPKLQLQARIQLEQSLSRKSNYNSYNNLIFIINNQQLSVYDIQTKLIKNLVTLSPMRNVMQYKSSLILIGYNNISIVKCDPYCKESIIFDYRISQQGFLYIHNNFLYSTLQTTLISYDLDKLIHNISFEPIKEQLDFNIIDISEDKNGNMCMVYINYQFELVFIYLQEIKTYNILQSFRNEGVDLDFLHHDVIYSMKLFNNCQLVFINAYFGTYFIELQSEIKFLAQIVIPNPINLYVNQILFGQKSIFYIYQQQFFINIYKFTYEQIYNSKYIDFSSKLIKYNQELLQNDYYFTSYEDELYVIQPDNLEQLIYKVNPDIIIQLEENIAEIEQIQITLSNSDENKSFIIEIVIEDNNLVILYQIIILMILFFYIWLIYRRVKLIKQ